MFHCSLSPTRLSGDEEKIIVRIRIGLRTAQTKQDAGDASGAARAQEKANDLAEQFRRQSLVTWGRRVEHQIPFASIGEKEEAVAELQLRVMRAILDITPTPSNDHWERRYNQCVLRRAIDICRPIQKEYGYGGGSGSEETTRRISFGNIGENNADAISESEFVERLPDKNAEREIEKVLGRQLLDQLIAVLGEKDRNNLRLWWRWDGGETWDAIGQSEGLKPDTVRKRVEATLRTMERTAESLSVPHKR